MLLHMSKLDKEIDNNVALLFIDITSFSKTIQGFSNAQIKTYLDDYYDRIIPIIYEYIVANATKKLEKERSIYYGNV